MNSHPHVYKVRPLKDRRGFWKLILDIYSHVRPQHSWRMAQLMTSEQPANVIGMQTATVN